MKFIFVDELPEGKNGLYLHYEHRKTGGVGWEYRDIKPYISRNQHRWLDEVNNWHATLSQRALEHSQWWWLIPASRIIAWDPPVLKPLFFAMAAIDMCRESSHPQMYLVRCPQDVAEYIREFMPESYIRFQNAGSTQTFSTKCCVLGAKRKRGPYKLLGNYLRRTKPLLTFTRKALGNPRGLRISVKNTRLLIYSHLLDFQILQTSDDHFFGKIFDHIPALTPSDQSWLYFLHRRDTKTEKDLETHMRKIGKPYIKLHDLITLPDILKVWGMCLQMALFLIWLLRHLPPLFIGGYQSHVFPRKFLFVYSRPPVTEFEVYFSLKRLLKHLKPPLLVYPYEEKGLEKAILKACKETHEKIRTVGFAHAVHNCGHLYLRKRQTDSVTSPKPDVIGTTGPAARAWLQDWAGIEPDRTMVIGSNRYSEPLPVFRTHDERSACLRILFFVGPWYEAHMIANYAEEIEDLFESCELLVRKYPYAWDAEQEQGLARLKTRVESLKVNQIPLREQLEWCDAVLFSSSSAGIEAMLNGRLAVYVHLHDFLVLDPLIGKGDISKVPRCESPLELKETLRMVRRMSQDDYMRALSGEIEFAREIYSPVNQQEVASILSSEACAVPSRTITLNAPPHTIEKRTYV